MHTVAIAVMSLDGCLTRHDEEGTVFASPADQRFFREALRTFDCAVMGGAAYRAAREPILANLTPGQLRVVLTRAPDSYADDAQPGVLEFRSDDAAAVIRDLATRGYARCALLGGARLLTSCVRARLLDELWLTLEPLAFGEGRRLFQGAVEFHFELINTELLGPNTVLLRYRSSS
jgi:dihydrofolate reductase